MKTTILPILLLGSIAATSAPAHAETFNGPYVGVTTGWDQDKIANSTINAQPIDARVSHDALVLGGYAGYNRKLTDRIVIGGEVGLSANVDDKLRTTSAGQALTVDPRYSFDLTARAGYLVTSKTLLYVRGGYANNRVRTLLDTPAGEVRASRNLDGWLVGGGVEYAITPKISARAEYRYSDFRRDGGRYDRHQTLIGVSYNF